METISTLVVIREPMKGFEDEVTCSELPFRKTSTGS